MRDYPELLRAALAATVARMATTKLAQLRAHFAAGDLRAAIAIAARFPRLGAIRNAVLDAHTAFTNPRFLTQLGRDPQACIDAGCSALIAAFSLDERV